MVDDDVARQAREQRCEVGLALGKRSAVEQLRQTLAAGRHQALERVAAGDAEHDRLARALDVAELAQSPRRAATRAASTECWSAMAKASVGPCSPTRPRTQH